jgi:hypothetical protein
MTEPQKGPGLGQAMAGAFLVALAAAFMAGLLFSLKDVLHGRFDQLPFFQSFFEIVSKNNTITLNVQGTVQKIPIPQSVFFISGMSMLLFAAAIAAGLLKALLSAGLELIHGGPRRKLEAMMAELRTLKAKG